MNRIFFRCVFFCLAVFLFVGCGKRPNQTIDPKSDLFAERAAFQDEISSGEADQE